MTDILANIEIVTGVDIVDIARIRETLSKWQTRFLSRCFTRGELESGSRSAEYFAGRFAVKEAVVKALGTGMTGIAWTDIEVNTTETGSLKLLLHRAAEKEAVHQGWFSSSVSISHTDEIAVAVVTALKTKGRSV